MFSINNLGKKYDDEWILRNLNLNISKNEIVSILGPSGCGKTTLLNIISGLIEYDEGKVIVDKSKKISYLFQEPRLLEWKTVFENVEFVVKNKIENSKERREKVEEYLESVGMIEYKNYYPNKISGGMKQRTALARAFVFPSQILLMDEPFKSLDLQLRFNLIKYFKKLWQKENRTVMFVTHDIQSSIQIGDRIVIMSSKPSKEEVIINNNTPLNSRRLDNDSIVNIEKRIYKIMLSDNTIS
ncbi:ABC transporter ATP-binding protein [Clostridium sp. DL1XJH146]